MVAENISVTVVPSPSSPLLQVHSGISVSFKHGAHGT